MVRSLTESSESGTATLEFALTASFFFLMIVAIVSGAHLFWTHNALVEATRRGARYAASQCKPTETNCPGYTDVLDRIKNVVVYGGPTAGTTPFVPGLTPDNVVVTHSTDSTGTHPENNFGVASGTVSVKIVNYNYKFALASVAIPIPPYETTVAGENAGFIPGGPSTCP
jgi:Flp pilus assembly protein TadG